MDDANYRCVFGDTFWKTAKGSLVIVHGSKFGTLYMLHVLNIHNHVIYVIENLLLSLWH